MLEWFRQIVPTTSTEMSELFPSLSATFIDRCRAIDWGRYETAYGDAIPIAEYLVSLADRKQIVAMAASHALWCSLCHQHAFVSSAAVPALPFILEVLRVADEQLSVEILDILRGFSACTSQPRIEALMQDAQPDLVIPPWQLELREQLIKQIPLFQGLATHSNEEMSDFASSILEDLQN